MIRRLLRRMGGGQPNVYTLSAQGSKHGRVLYSYLKESLPWRDGDPRFQGHSNRWESREISRIFQTEGFEVAGIDWTDHQTIPPGEFSALFDIDVNLARLAPKAPSARKLLHLTENYAPFQNAAEQERLAALEARRGVRLTPRRLLSQVEGKEESLKIADACSLIGNDVTLATYPKKYRSKITLVTVSASSAVTKKPEELVPSEREFLWFFGGGALHKGLDLVLEVFAKNPDLVLNVVGGVAAEEDFFGLYRKELTELPNIHLHNHINPAGEEFREIISRCFCFIAPSCSESISAAVATCLQVGLYPVISRQTGVDLPAGQGIYLEDCSIEEIEEAVRSLVDRDEDQLRNEIFTIQQDALRRYSRDRFSEIMRGYIEDQLEALA